MKKGSKQLQVRTVAANKVGRLTLPKKKTSQVLTVHPKFMCI